MPQVCPKIDCESGPWFLNYNSWPLSLGPSASITMGRGGHVPQYLERGTLSLFEGLSQVTISVSFNHRVIMVKISIFQWILAVYFVAFFSPKCMFYFNADKEVSASGGLCSPNLLLGEGLIAAEI